MPDSTQPGQDQRLASSLNPFAEAKGEEHQAKQAFDAGIQNRDAIWT